MDSLFASVVSILKSKPNKKRLNPNNFFNLLSLTVNYKH